MISRDGWFFSLVSAAAFFFASPVRAELISLEWHTREPFAEGMSFGEVGPYEKLYGVARFAVDPAHLRNKVIVDLENAPRNAKGLVEFASDVYLLRPKDLSRANGALFYEVDNRGKKEFMDFFNGGNRANNLTAKDVGNGFLFRRGYCMLWCGWVGELHPGEYRLLLQAPIAQKDGKPITGIVRYEMITDTPTTEAIPLSNRHDHGCYPPTAKGEREGVLTWRMRQTDERVVIPRDQWSLERHKTETHKGPGVSGALSDVRLKISGGFRPGYLYELVCESEGPIVQGLGFAGVRDLVSFLKNDGGKNNPLSNGSKSIITRAYAFGGSQSGRFLRQFLYQGFNIDESDRMVFDGLMPHVTGGGLGSFNHRFAQPTRHNGQHKEHQFPADVFPFNYGDSVDEFTTPEGKVVRRGEPDGILKRLAAEKKLPKIMHTQTSSEYWHRSGSLVHTNTLGTMDAALPDNMRLYVIGGTQHNPAKFPPERGAADNFHNPGDCRPHLRALLDALDAWVQKGTEPPPSIYPRVKDGTLVNWNQKSTGFPSLPGVRYPQVIQHPSAMDFGPEFKKSGIITVEPPRVLGEYTVLVPKSNADGIDTGCLLPVEVRVPTATYTGWNLRKREVGAEGQLAALSLGSYFPFPKTEAERRMTGDPRESVEKRYGSFAGYRKAWETARDELVKGRYLLAEDADYLTGLMNRARPMFPAEK